MAKSLFRALGLSALLLQIASSFPLEKKGTSNSAPDAVKIHWIDGTPDYNPGTTFGLPWPKGTYYPNETEFTITPESSDEEVSLQSWVTGYWRDGSIKWTGHALPPTSDVHPEYTVRPSSKKSSKHTDSVSPSIKIKDVEGHIKVDTGNITATFPKSGNVLVKSIITANGSKVGENGKLILQSQDKLVDSSELSDTKIQYDNFESKIDNVTVSDENTSRTLVTVHGKHHVTEGKHKDWLPFVVRFYLYAGSSSIRIMHSIIFDGDHEKDFIRGLGLRFDVPLKGEELYDRHVRLPGVDVGYLHESVHGITGLRRDPGQKVKTAQFEGKKLPDKSEWDSRVTTRLKWIPVWNDYKLNQLSPDGFTLKKRTKKGQGWINIPGGTRSHGLTYLGGATKGGLALGLRDFWKRYPNGFEISNASKDKGELTLWLYNPEATPLDMRPFHDDMGMDNYTKQLDALEITYEDYEPKFNTPYGISRSSEIYLYAFDATPSTDYLAKLSKHMNLPPALTPEMKYVQETQSLGNYWGVQDNSTSQAQLIEKRLDLLIEFYKKQVDYRRWYGFLDYGDVMHTYDNDRHTWRYDVGGYAWDNSELSSDMWLWQYYLHTGRADVYRFAEAMLRHTSEVDVYHYGKWNGLGTRHSVQHFSDSAKQVRITQPQYRKYFYFLSGGDERVGELLDEALDADKTFDVLDDQRKVRTDGWVPKPGEPVSITLGTDWSSLAAGWLIEWERRGKRWEEARMKLTNAAAGIGNMKYGFLSGYGLLHINNGSMGPAPADPENKGYINVNQLNAVFGLLEVVSEMVDYYGDKLPKGFDKAFLQYCEYYHSTAAIQNATFGSSWTENTLFQGHSRLEAYYAWRTDNATAATKAWNDFWNPPDQLDFRANTPWNTTFVNGSDVLIPVEEAPWLSTNSAAQYGLAAIQDLHLAKKWIGKSKDGKQ
ncbi:hypothetical protein AAP_05729 [Ascosphaera apis ARSEF 7405]|uniref:Tat pathway signal sequence domain protein n=1 Tax=Ascosphaera apis ARSEF 7405 TaxID=392613 RepID=A0A167VCS9_9EURO|nr:hypothetical protein AAP_05729 [Ascosphaera apis ARSEF 7405]